MQIRLSHKLFGIFFLILVIVVSTMMLSQRIFFLNFSNYVRQVESEKLERFATLLQKEYKTIGSWEHLLSNSKRWRRIVELAVGLPELPGQHPCPGNHPLPPVSVPFDHLWDDSLQRPPHPPPVPVFLLDTEYRLIFGIPGPHRREELTAIKVDGQTVGWLGMHEPPPFISGPPADLLQRQAKQLFLLGSVVIALTVLIAFVFSRYLLKPIQRLTDGTRELANRNFAVRITATTSDELGQLSENFNTMAQTLEHFEKMRGQWLTDISHEMRTPLAILRGEIEALQDGVRNPSIENLASLHSEVERISKLVDDLHLLSKADSDSLVLNMQRISPCTVLEDITDKYLNRFAQCNIAIELMLDNVRKVRIKGDVDRLGQVFANLFENVLKYVKSPGILSISGYSDNGMLTLYFQDSGPGVPDEALPRLFDRLYRVDGSRSRDTGGSGLGLSICRQIIDNHNGFIWAEHSHMGGLAIVIGVPSA